MFTLFICLGFIHHIFTYSNFSHAHIGHWYVYFLHTVACLHNTHCSYIQILYYLHSSHSYRFHILHVFHFFFTIFTFFTYSIYIHHTLTYPHWSHSVFFLNTLPQLPTHCSYFDIVYIF